ncbi:YybH family protein [Fodinicola acaciae]|uniref:YybH family protein n=1 Tax=Fodinicola acaciae TaxID=2681555 RepID=UPI0013D21E07|nr:nuclear transport factor 2 family protein [Fodinicola acaciae]
MTSYGPSSGNLLSAATNPDLAGAYAALESFYYALNQRDLEVLSAVWSDDPEAQLNNPLGGILRGGQAIAELYRKIFEGPVRLTVTFGDFLTYSGTGHAVFAGRETGHYDTGSSKVPLAIRTSRYFRYDEVSGRWRQFHHHGSIDAPAELARYQQAVTGG